MGPFPIPNGQTTSISTPVSGRVTAIVVDPTDVVWEKPARMNLTYGTLETVP